MFLTIAKFLYLDLKEQKLKTPDPTNEMAELDSKMTTKLAVAPKKDKKEKKDCKC